jgi:hypothetical protein
LVVGEGPAPSEGAVPLVKSGAILPGERKGKSTSWNGEIIHSRSELAGVTIDVGTNDRLVAYWRWLQLLFGAIECHVILSARS